MKPYAIKTHEGRPVFECDWILSLRGDRQKMHLPGPAGESAEETEARGLSAVARKLRQLAEDYEDAARLLTDSEYRAARDARVHAFVLDMAEQDIADGWRCAVTGEEWGDEGDEDAQ